MDASLVVKLILSEADSQRALSFYEACVEARERLVAPHLLVSEVTNVLRQRMRAGHSPLSREQATELLDEFFAFGVDFLGTPAIYRHALRLADIHNLSAANDAQYLALAQLLDVHLWTADERLFNAVRGRVPLVRWIGSYVDGDSL